MFNHINSNLYHYAGNNPVKYTDPDGEALHIAIGAGIGAVVGGLSSAIAGGSFKDIAAAAVGGAVTGGMAAATCGMSLGATIIGSAMAGTAGYLAESMVAGNQATVEGVIGSGVSGAAGAMLGAVVDKVVNVAVSKLSQSAQSAKSQSHSNHGNSLNTTKPAKGYALKDNDTDGILKYGETTRGENRYTKKYLKENNAYMDFQANGTKREMHDWQHEKILEYKENNNGQRPSLNKSDW